MNGLENLFEQVPAQLPEELVQTLHRASTFWIERIVSLGHASPEGFWYDADTHEWVLLLSGSARVLLAGGAVCELRPGSFLDIPAHTRHRVEWTDPSQPTVWLAIHYAP
jgi:cupin 2 domain-containing protein